MKILITGTHSTGKSTLLEYLKREAAFKDFNFIGGVTREAASFGIKINEQGSDDTQLYCISKDVVNFLQNRVSNAIFDRSILDTYIYTKYMYHTGRIYQNTFKIIEEIYEKYRTKFDYIFWIRPEFLPVEDGVRSVRIDFQRDIDRLFEVELKSFKKPVHILKGTTEERIIQLKKVIWKNS